MRASAARAAAGLAFPGGGLFFWWQAGAIQGLSRRIELSRTPCVGASAGALAATLAACECDMQQALRRAVQLSADAGAFDRGPWGLYGIWGPIIRQWLDELLPSDAAERCRGRVSLLVNEPRIAVPLLPVAGSVLTDMGYPCVARRAVSDFTDRADLIDAAMASVHIPLFLDRTWAARFRGAPCVDGSLVLGRGAKLELELPGRFAHCPALRLAPLRDPRMRERYGSGWRDFLRLSGEETVGEMIEWGERYVDVLEAEGQLAELLAE